MTVILGVRGLRIGGPCGWTFRDDKKRDRILLVYGEAHSSCTKHRAPNYDAEVVNHVWSGFIIAM